MSSSFTFVAIVACAISCGCSVLAANEEPVAAETPSGESSPDTTASEESSSGTGATEEKTELVSTSLGGAVRLERTGEDIWAVSTRDPAQRAKLPRIQILGDWSYPDAFNFSPNDEWIFAPYHVGSCLSAAVLYHRTSSTKIDIFENFEELVWRNAARLKLLKADPYSEGMCAMIFFAGWSGDSSRLLVGLLGGDKHKLDHCYIYFNARTKKFEATNYLRRVSAARSQVLACPEPIDPLLPEAELKTRFELLDKQLNKVYSAKIAKIENDRVHNLRDSQRAWLKAREKGSQLYLNAASPSERERRKLDFFADVTAARIESLNESEDHEPFDFWERINEKPDE
jgi:uncharacterized protein YecT (DUF1311 family)